MAAPHRKMVVTVVTAALYPQDPNAAINPETPRARFASPTSNSKELACQPICCEAMAGKKTCIIKPQTPDNPTPIKSISVNNRLWVCPPLNNDNTIAEIYIMIGKFSRKSLIVCSSMITSMPFTSGL